MIIMAERRARQQCIADLPDAGEFARALPGPVALALANATHDRRACGHRAQSHQDAALLRKWGLCDFPSAIGSGLLLTNFGYEVRCHVLGEGLTR